MKKLVMLLFLNIFLINVFSVNSDLNVGSDGIDGIFVDLTPPINFSQLNVNSSDFWDNLDFPDNITGSEFWYNQTTLPAGTNQSVQFNNNGAFGSDSDFTYNTTNDLLSVINLANKDGDLGIQPNGEGDVVLFDDKVYGGGENGNWLRIMRDDGVDNQLALGQISTLNAQVIGFTSRIMFRDNAGLGSTIFQVLTSGIGVSQDKFFTFGTGTGGIVKMGLDTRGDQNAFVFPAPSSHSAGLFINSNNILFVSSLLATFRDYDRPFRDSPTLQLGTNTDPNINNKEFCLLGAVNTSLGNGYFDIACDFEYGFINISNNANVTGNLDVTGNLSVNDTIKSSLVEITGSNPSKVTLLIQGAVGQLVDFIQLKDGAGNLIMSVTKTGSLSFFGANIILNTNTNVDTRFQIDRQAISKKSAFQFTLNNAIEFIVGMSDSGNFGTGNEFFIGQTEGGTNPALWISALSNVFIPNNLNVTGNLSVGGFGEFFGTFNKTSLSQTGNVKSGGFFDSGGSWGTNCYETELSLIGGTNSIWCIDNGGDNLRFYDPFTSDVSMRANKDGWQIGDATHKKNLSVSGDIHNDGNYTGNQIYGEMWFGEDSQNGVTTVVTQSEFVNITGWTTADETGNYLNGINFILGNALSPQVSGRYAFNWKMSFEKAEGGANDREYQTNIFVNGVAMHNTESHRTLTSQNSVGDTFGTGSEFVNVGDIITLMTNATDGSDDIGVHIANVNMLRIGN